MASRGRNYAEHFAAMEAYVPDVHAVHPVSTYYIYIGGNNIISTGLIENLSGRVGVWPYLIAADYRRSVRFCEETRRVLRLRFEYYLFNVCDLLLYELG